MKSIKWDGKPISKAGLYSGIDIELYHAAKICDGDSISSGGLRKIFSQSPAHFFNEWRGNPQASAQPNKRSYIVGRAAHHLFLKHIGQQSFSQLFVTQPEEYENEKGEVKPWNNNAKECKRWHADRATESRTVLTASESEQIVGMALELGRHPLVKAGALNGAIERSIFWKDKATGIWLKSRPDCIPNDSGDFVDYKTCVSVQWEHLMRAIGEFGYHQQGALICEAARIVLDIKQPTFTLVFQEKTAPYCVRVVTLKENDLARGVKQNRAALDIFVSCLKSGHWPGPGGEREDAEYIEMSERQQKMIDEKLTILDAG